MIAPSQRHGIQGPVLGPLVEPGAMGAHGPRGFKERDTRKLRGMFEIVDITVMYLIFKW